MISDPLCHETLLWDSKASPLKFAVVLQLASNEVKAGLADGLAENAAAGLSEEKRFKSLQALWVFVCQLGCREHGLSESPPFSMRVARTSLLIIWQAWFSRLVVAGAVDLGNGLGLVEAEELTGGANLGLRLTLFHPSGSWHRSQVGHLEWYSSRSRGEWKWNASNSRTSSFKIRSGVSFREEHGITGDATVGLRCCEILEPGKWRMMKTEKGRGRKIV